LDQSKTQGGREVRWEEKDTDTRGNGEQRGDGKRTLEGGIFVQRHREGANPPEWKKNSVVLRRGNRAGLICPGGERRPGKWKKRGRCRLGDESLQHRAPVEAQ